MIKKKSILRKLIPWIIVLAASLIAFGALAFAFVRSGKKKKKKKKKR